MQYTQQPNVTVGKKRCNYANNYYSDQQCITAEHINNGDILDRTSTKNNEISFALYQMEHCPYCLLVRREIEKMGLSIELHNIDAKPEFYNELVEKGGKQQVPCLKIKDTDGSVSWLYESEHIVHYLQKYHFHQLEVAQ